MSIKRETRNVLCVEVSDDTNEQKCFFDERYRQYYKEVIDRRSAVTLARSTLYFHRVPCLERPRDKCVGSAVYDRLSVQFCPFLKPSVLANAAAAATQVAAC